MNKTILIADDDKHLLELYKTLFTSSSDDLDFFAEGNTSEDYDLSLYDNALLLLEDLKNRASQDIKVPICIFDMRMPHLDGLKAAQLSREIDEDIIVVVTAYSDVPTKVIRDSLKHNIYYFKKPFNEEELYSLIDSLTRQWNKEQENKKLQNELKSINLNLEKIVQEEIQKSRQKDEILLKQYRFSFIGEMLSNIAHHWRQPLNEVALIIQDLKDAYYFEELTKDYFEEQVSKSMDTLKDMSKTIDDFTNFFGQDKQKTVFDLEEAIKSSLNVISEAIKQSDSSVDIRVSISPNIKINGLYHEFCRAVLNIVLNSKDAIDKNQITNPFIEIETKVINKDDYNLLIKISDNGGGIPEDVIDRIFDPYVTTKHQSKGIGLGLFSSKTTIENNMGGKLYAKNEDKGASFYIELNYQTN